MGWIIALGLALAAFALLVLAFKAPRGGWEAIGAALLLGIAGFAWQARPAQPGAPKLAQEAKPKNAAALVAARQELAKQSGQMPNSWMVIADAFARNGQFGDAAGVVLGAGFGESARAARMTRGFAEIGRLAQSRGAQAETLWGLSGFGDLVLTCTSDHSRNFRFGRALGAGEAFDTTTTVEGAATARAVAALAQAQGLDMPVSAMVAALVDGKVAVADAMQALLTRPLKQE